tara:strand:+ start:142 stop:432 length:291 start_codon:yes stop_codon:yes gene_type:complete
MISSLGEVEVGSVGVHTTQQRGISPEEVASRCADKIVSVSENANPLIREQANAFKQNIQKVIEFYVRQGINGYKTDLYNEALKAGDDGLANIIRRL